MTLSWPALIGGMLALALVIAAILLAPLILRRRRTRGLARSGALLRCHFLPDGRRLPADELKSVPGLEEIQTAALTNLLHRRDIDVATYMCDWPTGRKLQTIALLRFDTVILQDFAIGSGPAADTGKLSPELTRFLERQVRPLCVSGSGHWLVVLRPNTAVQPEELSTFLGEVHSIAGMIKRSILAQAQLPQ